MLKETNMDKIDLSVIIVNWNTKKLLQNCLISIYRFTKHINFEVIVVDNGSKDGSAEMVSKKFPQVKLIPNRDNFGFTKANNQGIKAAIGEYILLLNSDTYLIENSLKKLVEYAKSLNNFGALAPLLLNEDRSTQQSVGFFPHLPQIFWWMSFIDDLPGGSILRPYHVDHNSFYKHERQVDWITGAAFFTAKEVIQKIGGLDEKIFMYGEDVELSYRIKKAGYNVYFSPQTKIVHIARGSSGKITKNAILGEYKSTIYFYQKHKSPFSLQMVKILLKIGALARILIFSILGRKETAKFYVEALKVA
ncbi:MAG: glycosyltransferase family 2 protein [Candidatus Curtissbacteria bacterium]|nr:glycosyltransferase family 2 protein [Candidatus Curtissbacteria bacterium]